MLTNTTYVGLGFTKTSRKLAVVEREAMHLATLRALPVAIWKDTDGYTGFVVEGDMTDELTEFNGFRMVLVKVMNGSGELNVAEYRLGGAADMN